jgi:lipopolysaccharide assembly outer membrane protein LptD (OstA)
MKNRLSVLLFLILPVLQVFAQNAPPVESGPSLNMRQIELEINTSSLPELALWCRSLGLSEGGTKTDLAKRLRDHFNLPEPQQASNDNRKILTIESAQATEYFRIEVVDEDYARLKGEVRISLKDKDMVHTISANEILFNRTRNIITARGDVEYKKVQGASTEIFRGSSITVSTDDWSSVFLGGNSEKLSEGTSYRFAGEVITRSTEDVMILRNAQISNAKNEETLWSVSASKIWLLPGSDFAIFNAVLKVGEIPVLYIPAFYYPADEVIFHPAVGYRTREGSFIQTTTYILGRPKADAAESSSISKILGDSNDMEKRREGLFLRSTGKKSTDPNTTILKALLDYYSNLGGYLGVDLVTPKWGILNSFNLTFGLGFTRTITPVAGSYSPFGPSLDEPSEWNKSILFSEEVPFRYRLSTQSSVNGKLGSLNWNLPFYSDPFVDRDFLDRAESMDWFNMVQQGAALEADTTSETRIQAYQWQLNGNLRPTFPKLAPYISSVALSSFSMTLAFKELQTEDPSISVYSPNYYYFSPDRATLFSLSGSVSGNPLNLGGGTTPSTSASTGTSSQTQKTQETEDPFKGIGVPRSPWETDDDGKSDQKTPTETIVPPVLSQRFDLPKAGNLRFSVNYQLSPTGSSELQFSKGKSEYQSILMNFGGNGNLNFNFNHSDNFFSDTVTFTGNGAWRDIYLNEEADENINMATGEFDEDKARRDREQQYNQTFLTTSYSNTFSLQPLYKFPMFSQTNFQYSFKGTLVKSRFTGTGDDPEWEFDTGTWEKEQKKDGKDIVGLTSHQLSTNLAANVMEKQQNISVSVDLPPFDTSFSTNANFRVWITDTNARVRVTKPEDAEKWKIEPFYLTETVKFGAKSTFSFYMIANVDPEEDYQGITTITSSLSLWDLRLAFSAVRMRRYEFKPDNEEDWTSGGDWVQIPEDVEEPALVPRDFSINYSRTFSNIEVIRNLLKFTTNLSTSVNFDLQRHTNSNFNLTFGLTLNITNFLDLTLSATSSNVVIFRYFKNVPGMESMTQMYPEGDQNNLFVDLFDSFNFWDDAKRRRTGFKMKNFRLQATHHLGDWNAVLGITVAPYLNTDKYPAVYELNTDLSFLVQWVPISEIKTDIKYEKKTDKWTVQQ